MIEEFAKDKELAEFHDTWQEYRKATKNGITALPDVSLRNLFGEMSMLQSHAEMRVALLETTRDRGKLDLELERSMLLTQTSGPMTKRNAEVESDIRYKNRLETLQTYDTDVTIAKGIARATTIAANSLSRELSARLKE
jgi:hypothetical protein